MSTTVSDERRALAERLDAVFRASGLSRQEWADRLGVTRGALWQWLDCRTVPRPDVWLAVLHHATASGRADREVEALLTALDVPLARLGGRHSSRREETLLEGIVAQASNDLIGRITALPFEDALDVIEGAMRHARRVRGGHGWEDALAARFERVVGQVVDTAIGPGETAIDRARLGAAAWRATYEWALAQPEEAIDEGRVTRVVYEAVRSLVTEWGGSLQSPVY